MKRTITSFGALALATAALHGAPVTPQQALSIATEARQSVASGSASHRAPGNVSPVLALTAGTETAADYYVFNYGAASDAGYVIVAGEDKAPAVLAYSDTGSFDPSNIPDGMNVLLDAYAQEMRYLRDHPWLQGGVRPSPRDREVKPLIKSLWNQNSPYNDLCPTYVDDDGQTQHSATGCVATSTSQIMYYYKWPKQGTGSYSFESTVNGGDDVVTMSANFGATTYDWDNMVDYVGEEGCTPVQGNALATLCYHVGVAVHMAYGSTSSSVDYAAMEALRNHFGYSPDMRFLRRAGMTVEQWERTIDNELDNKRPVIYGGFTKTGGHSFICDGYDKRGYYHFNWGWGGKSNGYFLISALAPRSQGIGSYEGGYNLGQSIVIGIRPDDGTATAPEKSIEVYLESLGAAAEKVDLGQPVQMLVQRLLVAGYGFYNDNDYRPSLPMEFYFCLTDADGNAVETASNANSFTSNMNIGWSRSFTNPEHPVTYTPSTSLADGDYKLWLTWACTEAGFNTYRYCQSSPGYLIAQVQDGAMYFSSPINKPNLSVTKFDYPQTIGTDAVFNIEATLHNNADTEYFDEVFYVTIKDGEPMYYDNGQRIGVAAGKDIITRAQMTAPSSPGDYQLAIVDRNGDYIGEPYPFTVIDVSDFYVEIVTPVAPTKYYMPSGNITFTAEISNTGTTPFLGTLPYMVLGSNQSSVLSVGESPVVNIPVGGKTTVEFASSFEGIEGVVYYLCLRNFSNMSKYISWGTKAPFEIKNDVTGISYAHGEDITITAAAGTITVTGARRVAVYDTTGRLVATTPVATLPSGLYIIVADNVTRKVAL